MRFDKAKRLLYATFPSLNKYTTNLRYLKGFSGTIFQKICAFPFHHSLMRLENPYLCHAISSLFHEQKDAKNPDGGQSPIWI